MRFNLLQAGGIVALEKGQRDGFGPGQSCDLILDQGVACRSQIPEIIDDTTWYGPCLQRQNRPHAREHCRIKRVGFGEVACGLCEAPGLARIDLGDWHACCG